MRLYYEVCDYYSKEGDQAWCVSHLSKVIFRERLLNGFQLTFSFFCSFHCSQVFSCAQHSLLLKYLEPRPNIKCVGGIVKNLGLLSSKSWWLQGQCRFQIWSFRDSFLPLAEMFVHKGMSNRIWVSCFAATFVLAQDHDAGYSSSSTSLHILKFSWALCIHLYLCLYKNVCVCVCADMKFI